ncbi:hypothetical protein KP2612_002962 [Komagataella phaffii]|nr:Predicted protein [Komagataella phaffii CBS 7435]
MSAIHEVNEIMANSKLQPLLKLETAMNRRVRSLHFLPESEPVPPYKVYFMVLHPMIVPM